MPEDAPPKDSGASGTLGRKVGPFTIGAWLAIGAAGLGLGLLIRRSSLFSGGAAPADLPTETPPDTYDPGLPGYQAVGGTAGQNNQPVVTGPSSTRPTTNSDWLRVAVEGLSGSDNIAPQKSQPALQKFLEGTAVTQQEADIVSLAIRRYGAPPEGAPALRLIGAGGPDDYRDLTTAQVLALGRRQHPEHAPGVRRPLLHRVDRRALALGQFTVRAAGDPLAGDHALSDLGHERVDLARARTCDGAGGRVSHGRSPTCPRLPQLSVPNNPA